MAYPAATDGDNHNEAIEILRVRTTDTVLLRAQRMCDHPSQENKNSAQGEEEGFQGREDARSQEILEEASGPDIVQRHSPTNAQPQTRHG